MPTLSDVIAYEEKAPGTIAQMQSGYPRFFRHPLHDELATRVCAEEGLINRRLIFTADHESARGLHQWARRSAKLFAARGLYGVHFNSEDDEGLVAARAFLQHTGCGMSTREAEAALGRRPHPEERVDGTNEAVVCQKLASIWGNRAPQDIYLCRGGMNALYAAFRSLRDVQAEDGRTIWVQLGWLYVDSIRVLEKMLPPGGKLVRHFDVNDLESLHTKLEPYRGQVAGIVTELPTNPLLQTPPAEDLQRLARNHGAALIVDPSTVSPCNVDVLTFADVEVCSLTKYAASHGDVMIGSATINPQSPFYRALNDRIPSFRAAPAQQDLARFAYELQDYESVVKLINENTRRVTAFLEAHPSVEWVVWANSANYSDTYQSIRKPNGGPGALITFKVRGSTQLFYDSLNIAKGPSFGTRFSLICPFMYLAHYDMVSSKTGRERLKSLGLHPELLRLSVGTEPVEGLLDDLKRSFTAATAQDDLA